MRVTNCSHSQMGSEDLQGMSFSVNLTSRPQGSVADLRERGRIHLIADNGVVTMRLLVWTAVLTALVAGWAPAPTAAAADRGGGRRRDGERRRGAGGGGGDRHAGNGGRRGAAHDGNGPSGGFPLRRRGDGEV